MMKTLSAWIVLSLVGWLAFHGCSSDSSSSDGGSVDGPVDPCACNPDGIKRCAGNTVETCTGGNWTFSLTCEDPTVCVADDCKGEICQAASCVQKTSECPDTARYVAGDSVKVERMEAVAVGKCEAGGASGSLSQFDDRSAEGQVRSLVLATQGCRSPVLNWPQIFGLNINGTVSPEGFRTSDTIPPHEFGQWYNQAIKLHRVATLWQGDRFSGKATLIDWTFKPQLATGDQCPVPPDLPPAGKIPVQFCRTWQDGCQACESP